MSLAYLCTPGEFVVLLSSMSSSSSDGELLTIRGVRKGKIEVISLFDRRSFLADHEDFIDSNEEGEDDEIEIDDDFVEDDIDVDAFHSKRQKQNNSKGFAIVSQSRSNSYRTSAASSSSRSTISMTSSSSSKHKASESGNISANRKLENLSNFLQNSPKQAFGWMELAKLKSEEGDQTGVYEALHRACVHCPLSIDESNPISTINMYIDSSQLLVDLSRREVVILKIRCLVRAINIARSSSDIDFKPPVVADTSKSSSGFADYARLGEEIRRVLALSFREFGRALLALENLYISLGKPSSCLNGAAVAFRMCKDLDQEETLEYAESYNNCFARLADTVETWK